MDTAKERKKIHKRIFHYVVHFHSYRLPENMKNYRSDVHTMPQIEIMI